MVWNLDSLDFSLSSCKKSPANPWIHQLLSYFGILFQLMFRLLAIWVMIVFQNPASKLTYVIWFCSLHTRNKSSFHLTVLLFSLMVPLSIILMNDHQSLRHHRGPEGTAEEILLHRDIINHMKQNRSSRSKLQPIYWVQTDGSSYIRKTRMKACQNQYGLKPTELWHNSSNNSKVMVQFGWRMSHDI